MMEAPTDTTPLSPDTSRKANYNTTSSLQNMQNSSLSIKHLITESPEGEQVKEGPPWFKDYFRPCVAEFFAVMVFVFIGTLSVVTGTPIGIAVAHGFTIALLVAGFGPISGAHINPAVTLGVVLGGGCEVIKGILYVVFQLAGSVVGAGWARGVLSFIPVGQNVTQYELIGGAAHTLPAGVTSCTGVLTEVALTMVLVMTVLMTAVNTDGHNVIHPLCIGFAVIVDILAGMNVSGASMNPARSFGPAVMMSGIKDVWPDFWVYLVGPAVGALIAVVLFRFIFGGPGKCLAFKNYD